MLSEAQRRRSTDSGKPSARILLLAAKLSYRTDDFVAAAKRLGVELVVAVDRCHMLDREWKFDSLLVELGDPELALAQMIEVAKTRAFDALVATDDATAELAARASLALGISGNSIESVENARNKKKMRAALKLGLARTPRFQVFSVHESPTKVASQVGYPCVIKPLVGTASRGVMRADSPAEFVERRARLAALLKDDLEFIVEEFVAGAEVALEAILKNGELTVLALFDKPDPLDGPFFEETIYVTPSRHPVSLQQAIIDETRRAACALGLRQGPIHAELRLGADGPVVIEVAARSIGGLCSRTLRFGLGSRSLEEIVIADALGRSAELGPLELSGASGVMMIPIPKAGVLKSVAGVDDARGVALIDSIEITVRPGEVLVPLPEGATYLGFIFARGDAPAAVEAALRQAHAKLHFEILPRLPAQ